jgi:uncharacterized membrane protein YfcA
MIALPDLATLAISEPVILVAYIVFGIIGFGSSLVSTPLLAHALPVSTVVPVMAMLDLVAAWSNGWRMSAHVVRAELWRLIPSLLLGSVIGAWLLLTLPVSVIVPVLGLFVLGYGLRGLRTAHTTTSTHLNPRWAWFYGTAGGMCSALFGVGGFVYASYLTRRLDDVQQIRAMQGALFMISSLVRVVLFVLSGQLLQAEMLGLVLCLLPGMAVGVYLGHRIGGGMDRPKFLRALYLVLIFAGGSLLLRAWA